LDLKKYYDLPDKEKYDKIPEIWEGHNIADFVDPDIAKKLEALEKEEELREKAGLYDEEMSDDDEETRELKRQAKEIREKQLLIMGNSREKRHSNKPRMPRQGRKRERSESRLQKEFAEVGLDVSLKRMRHLSQVRSRSAKRPRLELSQTRSKSRNRSKSCDQMGLKDEKAVEKVNRMAKKAQKTSQHLARVGEADRRIYTLMPKHLFSGKRGQGKTDRR